MNYLILGGNGYLGSKVTRTLVGSGNTVVCTKRLTSDLSRLSDIQKNITWIPASVDAVDAAMRYTNFDYVLNMACNYGRSDKLYDNVIEANIEFPLRVLNKVSEKDGARYLTIGTGLPENLNMYSFSKKMFNEFGRFYSNKHNVTFVCLSLEMLYGADEPESRFLPSMIRRMIKGQDVETTIGTQHRDLISVDDIIKAIVMILNFDLQGYHEIFVGTGIAPTISEVVDYIWENTGMKSQVYKGAVPMRENEPDCVADISVISRMVAWNPIPWRKGIEQMIKDIAGVL